MTLADFATENQIVGTFTIDDPNQPLQRDVTAFLQSLVDAGEHYAGLIIRHAPCPGQPDGPLLSAAAVGTSNTVDPSQRPTLSVTFGPATPAPPHTPVDALRVVAVPNPFNPNTTLHVDVLRSGRVQIDLFDLRGRLVRPLASRSFDAGRHTIRFDGLDAAGKLLASGTYFVHVRSQGDHTATKIILLK